MNIYTLLFTFLFVAFSYAQDKDKEREQLEILKRSNGYIYEGNELRGEDNYISAEMEYRKAISEQPTTVAGAYNLGNSYYEKGSYDEALYRLEQAAKNASDKSEKHKAYHNIGNILMKSELCKEAVEAYKNALRNNPGDDETRYNLALAKECAEQQQEQNKDEEKKDDDKKEDENKEDQEKKDQENDDQKDNKEDEGDQDKKDGEDEKDDQGKPQDEKEKEGKGDKDKEQEGQPKPKQGQLSPQQIKSLLEAMNNQEQKVQEKLNAEKQKGAKVKTEKDW